MKKELSSGKTVTLSGLGTKSFTLFRRNEEALVEGASARILFRTAYVCLPHEQRDYGAEELCGEVKQKGR